MICAGESMKPAGVCPVLENAVCGDLESKPGYELLDGPRGRVVVRDDGNGVFDAGDEIYAVAEGEAEVSDLSHGEEAAEDVKERLKAMGIGESIPFGTSLKPLGQYVRSLNEAKGIARGAGSASDVEKKLAEAKDAAEKAGIPVDMALEAEIRGIAEYYGLVSIDNLSGLPYFDKDNRRDVEGQLDDAKDLAEVVGIPADEVRRDAGSARFVLANTRFAKGLTFASEGRKEEALKAFADAKSIADMGDFEEAIEQMLNEEYAKLISIDVLSGLPFFDEINRKDVEGQLDAAAIVGQAAGIPADRIGREAQDARFELCLLNYRQALKLAGEGRAEEARALREKADSISDMGDYDAIFKVTSNQIDVLLSEVKNKNESMKVAGGGERGGLDALLDEIEGALNHLPHPFLKGSVKARAQE